MVKKKIVYPKVELFFDAILTTAETRSVTKSGILLADNKGNIETKQTVVAVGPTADVAIGDLVEIDPGRFKVKLSKPKHDIGPDIPEVQVPIEIVDNIAYLMMSTRELKYKYI